MPSNPILICAKSDGLRTELERSLTAAGYETTAVVNPPDAVAAMRGRRFDLVVVEGLPASGAIGSLRKASEPGITPVLVVAPARDVEARIAFLEAGADDVITTGFALNELENHVMALLIRSGRVEPESDAQQMDAQLVAFFSPKGGVGTTTLAVNTAVLLAGGGARPARGRNARVNDPAANGGLPASRVLILDLDLQFGQVATHLNLTPRYDVGVLATDEQALDDPDLARSYLAIHDSGLAVMAAPPTPEADFRITQDQLQRTVDIYRPYFDYIVVDLGSRLDPRTLWILDQAAVHVFVLFPEIAALRAMSLLGGFLADATMLRAEEHIVVNHVFPKELLKVRDIEALLRTKPAAEIPYTEVDMIRAVNEGVPLVISRPTSPAAAALRRLAQVILGIDVTRPAAKPSKRRGLFTRR